MMAANTPMSNVWYKGALAIPEADFEASVGRHVAYIDERLRSITEATATGFFARQVSEK